MKNLVLKDGTIVQVSKELYRTTTDAGLWRKINGLEGHKELGWHPKIDWVCLIQDRLCYNGVPPNGKRLSDDIYIGFHKDWILLNE